MRRNPNAYQWAVDGPPVGVWQTAEGTFSNVMATTLTFKPDGTGEEERYSALFGVSRLPLLWRFERPGELGVFRVLEQDERPDSDGDWDVFPYRADWRRFDAGEGPVLVNNGTKGWFPSDGFWTLLAPVHLIGRA